MKYKFILFSPWLLKSPGYLNSRLLGHIIYGYYLGNWSPRAGLRVSVVSQRALGLKPLAPHPVALHTNP